MTLTERQAELMHEHHRTSTPRQYDAWHTGGEPQALKEEPEDRRAEAVGRFMAKDPDLAHGYICDELSNALIVELGGLLICGDDQELLRRVKQVLTAAHMCDGAERYFGSEQS